jgi:hypothetical protein
MGDYQAAKAALKDALKLNPRYPDALCDLGRSGRGEQRIFHILLQADLAYLSDF